MNLKNIEYLKLKICTQHIITKKTMDQCNVFFSFSMCHINNEKRKNVKLGHFIYFILLRFIDVSTNKKMNKYFYG